MRSNETLDFSTETLELSKQAADQTDLHREGRETRHAIPARLLRGGDDYTRGRAEILDTPTRLELVLCVANHCPEALSGPLGLDRWLSHERALRQPRAACDQYHETFPVAHNSLVSDPA